jgi:hypothetical protein
MSATLKDVDAGIPDPGAAVVDRTWRFQTAFLRRPFMADADRMRIIAIYRARACECLERARLAHNDGLVVAAHGYLDEAETWTRFADAWAGRVAADQLKVLPTEHSNLMLLQQGRNAYHQ